MLELSPSMGYLVPWWVVVRPTNTRPLCADQVDVLDKCGSVDPMAYIPKEIASVISQPDSMFPLGVTDIKGPAPLRRENRDGYVRLLVRQLRSSKVGLVAEANASGGTFAVGKNSTGRQREVWEGSVMEAALVPPKPPLLADPARLIHFECSHGRPLWLSKRDAEVWFDQLKLPQALSSYMGRPSVTVKEPLHAGMSTDAIQAYAVDDTIELTNDAKVTPVNLTWAMGFSWSSFIAQSVMTGSCCLAGFPRDCFLTEADRLPPTSNSLGLRSSGCEYG